MHSNKNIFIQGAISPEHIADSIAKHQSKYDIGAHGIFLGQVRGDNIGERKVAAIQYSSYEDMAMGKIGVVRETIFAKYPLICMHIYHSLGIVKSGEICLFVFTSSAHRKPAIEACEEMVELIKKEIPIWGKEIFEDDTHQWKKNK
ncbi:MAG: molybdenum cofactor biosynthesis protein MoaE [Flavitalea sp.]